MKVPNIEILWCAWAHNALLVEGQFSGSAPHYLVLYLLNLLTPFKIADLQKLQL
jgi:hypothetical protein